MDVSFFDRKRVLVTGHTGFKGAWLSEVLLHMGAHVTGYSLEPPTDPSLFEILQLGERMNSHVGDIRDFGYLKSVFENCEPEIVIHMAAQPIVRESYRNPRDTYDINVMGTVNVLECIRTTDSVKSFVNVTTDKVYKNREWEWGYRENEELNGYDPYSNSKSCSELVTDSYRKSFFGESECAISTMRAGNVIGGGDFAADRIVPDCYRAAVEGESVVVRNPYSVRPYQHVLEAVMAYLMVAEAQYKDKRYAGAYNVGPEYHDAVCSKTVVDTFYSFWNQRRNTAMHGVHQMQNGPHEATFLKLDCAKLSAVFGWQPVWNFAQAMEHTVDVYEQIHLSGDVVETVDRQIREYLQRFSFVKNDT